MAYFAVGVVALEFSFLVIVNVNAAGGVAAAPTAKADDLVVLRPIAERIVSGVDGDKTAS